MNRATTQALDRLNRDFYRRRAAAFAATRRGPWPGWGRARDAYLEGRRGSGGRILDLGCGNGRLAAFLAPRLGADHTYLGIDRSPPLLAEARRFAVAFGGARWLAADLTAAPWPLAAAAGAFSWIAAFGVFHHVAGFDNRCRLMARLARRLAPGGIATVSFWRFAARARFRARAVDWGGVAAAELERGDFVLRWGDGDDLRYCHHVDAGEAAALAGAAGLEVRSAYLADGEGGDLNRYLLLSTAAG